MNGEGGGGLWWDTRRRNSAECGNSLCKMDANQKQSKKRKRGNHTHSSTFHVTSRLFFFLLCLLLVQFCLKMLALLYIFFIW